LDDLRSLSTATLGLRGGFDGDSFGILLSLMDLVYIKLNPNATEPIPAIRYFCPNEIKVILSEAVADYYLI
jgi:hypothetical protein